MEQRRSLVRLFVLLLTLILHVWHVTADVSEENVLGHVAQFEEQMEMEMMNPAVTGTAAAGTDTSAATSASNAVPVSSSVPAQTGDAAAAAAAAAKSAAAEPAVAAASPGKNATAATAGTSTGTAAAAAASTDATAAKPAETAPPAPPAAAAAASTLPPNENEHPSIRGLANGAQATLWIPEIIFENLELLDLRFHQGIHCNASSATCPAFSPCPSAPLQASRISACSPDPPFVDSAPVVSAPPLNHLPDAASGAASDGAGAGSVPPYPYSLAATQAPASFDEAVAEPFAAQVFLLENVFLNDRGSVFDATYYYRHGLFCRSCPIDTGLYTGGTTAVYVFDHLVSLAYWNGPNFYHTMLEVMPSLLFLRPFLSSHLDLPAGPIPVVVRQLQELYTHLFALVNVSETSLNIHIIPDDALYFVRRLYLPAQAQCGRPSAALVTHLRNEYLVPPPPADNNTSGNSNSSLSAGGNGNGSVALDWCVVVGQRDTTRRIVGRSQLLQELFSIFPSDRIVLFRGNLPVFDAKRLFNRARLFISPHGALMTNMVFMPSLSHVVEVRPHSFDNNCYHFLAHICRHSYYLVHGNGTKNSDIHVDMDELIRVVKEIAGNILT
ncbi:hypothetical protein CLOM_g14452 [Closterium sp. NIES-68]|nr:hypothetical protein CLOM_g14452 [Closterium sp. NIES-68]GJP82273.1 hypothetical protein CLOP_g12508 [Closterium sp. NIES-67]